MVLDGNRVSITKSERWENEWIESAASNVHAREIIVVTRRFDVRRIYYVTRYVRAHVSEFNIQMVSCSNIFLCESYVVSDDDDPNRRGHAICILLCIPCRNSIKKKIFIKYRRARSIMLAPVRTAYHAYHGASDVPVFL